MRLAILAAAVAVLSPVASAYYYWIYFAGRSAPFTPVPARFDIANLPNHSIPLLISSQGPSVMMPGDTFNALISQIQAAANVWNGVSTSAGRLQFAGLSPMTQPDATPEVDVVFDNNITPGLLAITRITTVADVSDPLANGATFIPVVNARVQFFSDLTINQQSSFSDSFFLTMVHELGHALGLQHTLTSSVMSTQYTAAVTKATPLAADDVAGISMLYPANGFGANTGSVTGTISVSGGGVNMASVVALSTTGVAVSAITNPDGTYQINGIPPGLYYVYAHPLPPAEMGEAYPDNVFPPQDPTGAPFPANTSFGTQFFGGTTDWTQTTQIAVTAGQATSGINFNAPVRSGPAISAVTTYGYLGAGGAPGPTAVGEPPLQNNTVTGFAFTGNGLAVTNKGTTNIAPGLQVSVIGGTAQVVPKSLAFYTLIQGFPYLEMEIGTSAVSSPTPTALAFTLNGDLYVLPAAFTVVPGPPPAITAVNGSTDGNGNSVVNIAGANLTANTTVLFDGAQASVQQVNADGSLTVTAPPAANGYHAVVEALGPSGQTSAQLLGSATPLGFVYGGPGVPAISVNPPVVSAGADQMVQITGYNTNFADGQTVVGFGSSDITITHVWVVSPGLLQMNISVNQSAAAGTGSITVASGLQLATLSAPFQIAAANPAQITLRTPILNQATGLPGVPVSGAAVINTNGLPFTATMASVAGWMLTIQNQPAAFTLGNQGQLIVQVPPGLLTGPAVVQWIPATGAVVPPVLMQVDPPPPVILSVQDTTLGTTISAPNVASAGDAITLLVTGLSDAFGNFPAPSQLAVNVGGVNVTPSSLTGSSAQGDPCQIQVTLPATLATGPQNLIVRYGTRESAAFVITLQ